MRILMVLLLGFVSLAAAMPPRPEVPKRKAPVRQSTTKGAAAARAKAHLANGKAKRPPARSVARNNKPAKPPARPKVYHK